MSYSISQTIKAPAAQMLTSLTGLLEKAAKHAEETKTAEENFLSARLYPNMFPLTRQVQLACDFAARGTARVASHDMPSFPDTETSFAELIARCHKAIEFIMSVPDEALDEKWDAIVNAPAGPDTTIPMPAQNFVSGYLLPNMYFHISMAYALLRHQGVPLGKRDFIMKSE